MFDLDKLAADPEVAAIVVDMQPDFYSTGALPVPGGETLVEKLQPVLSGFQTLVFTQDSHPVGHISFASSYEGKKPFDVLTLKEVQTERIRSKFSQVELENYLKQTPEQRQVLWPDHCVQGTRGWELDSRLPIERAHLILRKGTKAAVDSYSGFFENNGGPTGLSAYLKSRGVKKVFICGLAGDFCVLWTTNDAEREGFQVFTSDEWTRFVFTS